MKGICGGLCLCVCVWRGAVHKEYAPAKGGVELQGGSWHFRTC